MSRIARARGALQSHVEHKILATRAILEQRLDELEIRDINHRRECQKCVEEFVSKGYCTAAIPLINASIYVIKRRLGTLRESDIHKLNNWNGLINRSWMLFVDMLEK